MKVAKQATELNLLRSKYKTRKDYLVKQRDELKKGLSASNNSQIQALENDIAEIGQLEKELDQSYESIDSSTPVTADSLHAMGFDDWVRLTNEDLKRAYSEVDRIAYENFVQGYLYYFEKNINQKDEADKEDRNYTIYFDWSNTRSDSALVVYIKPALDNANYHDYSRSNVLAASGKGHATVLHSAGFHGQHSPFAPPPSMTDPVQPPPPPPPTQR